MAREVFKISSAGKNAMFCRTIHTVVVIILNLFDFSNLKRVLSSNHLRNFCPPRTLYSHDLSFFVYGLRTRIIETIIISIPCSYIYPNLPDLITT